MEKRPPTPETGQGHLRLPSSSLNRPPPTGPNMTRITFLLAFVLFTVHTRAADLTGTWKTEFDTQIGHQKYTFTFKQDGEKVTGKANSLINERKRDVELKDGKLAGDTLTFFETFEFQGQRNPHRLRRQGCGRRN
jgi:hypothetical protein